MLLPFKPTGPKHPLVLYDRDGERWSSYFMHRFLWYDMDPIANSIILRKRISWLYRKIQGEQKTITILQSIPHFQQGPCACKIDNLRGLLPKSRLYSQR